MPRHLCPLLAVTKTAGFLTPIDDPQAVWTPLEIVAEWEGMVFVSVSVWTLKMQRCV